MSAPSEQARQNASDAVCFYQAGDLTIDMGCQRVLRGDLEIPLPKLSFDLLLALVRAAPNVATLDSLMEEVWPGLVVSPETLMQRIKLLRDVLGDDSRSPRYIASLRSRGYRFIPPVLRHSEAGAGYAATEPQPSVPAPRRRWLLTSVVVLLGVGTIGTTLLMVNNATRDAAERVDKLDASALPAHTVAVLPFQDLSTQKQSPLIAFGIAEGLLHRLASTRGLTLIARTSSFAAATPHADAREIGRKLNARYLIEGSVQRSGDRLRITAQLIDAASGAHVWSLRFDRTLDDIFAVEDEITRNVAQALQVTLTEARHPYARFGTEAYLALLQGRALMATRKTADAEEAIKRFTRAIEIAPDFAIAYVDLANAHVILASLRTQYPSEPNREAVRQAHPLVAKALQLDDTLGEAYVLRGFIKAFEGDEQGAEADYRGGLNLAPNYGLGHEQFSEFLESDMQRFEEALAESERARVVDPLRPRNHYVKGRMLAGVGAFKEAEDLYLRALEVDPNYYPALTRLGEIRWEHGQFADAVKLAERAAAIEPAAGWVRWRLADLYVDIGDVEAARAVLADQTEDIQWVSLCMFTGDAERVAGMILGNPAVETLDIYEEEFYPYAIRDAALAKGRPAKARDALMARWRRARTRPSTAEWWGTRMALAHVQLALGNRPEAEVLARSLLQIDSHPAAHGIEYAKPVAHALLGENDAAVHALEENVDLGYLKRWWYTFERDPALQSALGADPRFQSLVARVRQHVSSQSTLLQQMRERGEVPTRKAALAPEREGC